MSATPAASGRGRWHYRWWLAGNIVMSMVVVAWLFLDARFEASLDWWQFRTSPADSELRFYMGDWWWLRLRNGALMMLVVSTGLAAVAMLFQFVLGSPVNRTLRSAMSLVAILALWLAIGTHWEDIVWQGKQYRLSRILNEFEAATEPLRERWPQDDGELEGLGPYMAYPVGRPRTLVMLTLPQMKRFPGSFAAVEGQAGGPYRFQLVDREEGDWLEWHPEGSQPASFSGGLGELYRLLKSHRLQDGWYLARYDR